MILLDIPGFLGHLHPLVVHLPIGFLLLALVFDLLSYFNRYAYLKTTVSVMGLTDNLQPYLDALEYEAPDEKTISKNIAVVKQICNGAIQEAYIFHSTL